MTQFTDSTIQRRRIAIQGIVQGVGFRPFVYQQATRWHLAGFVRNDSLGVNIEVEGPLAALDAFQQALYEEAPPLAQIDSVAIEQLVPCHESTFSIAQSQEHPEQRALISPDTTICKDCLHELSDPDNRRYRYPFINCTNCGPRFTIIQNIPYDRNQTTMHVFPMCPACQAEYNDPLNRRFHAQPNACSTCGPHVWITACKSWAKEQIEQYDAITTAAQRLAAGAILAIKGLGGYHLACDAYNDEAVQRLRQRKYREAKPFALMVPDITVVRQLCRVSEYEEQLLLSRQRPIVLLDQLPSNSIASAVAPAYNTLGIMLPYTPLHHLLLRAFAEEIGPARLPVLIMTSGNVSEEPIAYQDDDARIRLAVLADGMLFHNRAIYMRCDDSVVREVAGGMQYFRRSRSYVPEPISLSFDLPVPLLACGAHLKNTFCLGKGHQAFVSHHIGDLENLETLQSFREGIEHFQRLFDIVPEAIVCDMHPEYLATKYALDAPIAEKITVQHHHAHIASVMAEHGLSEPIIGIAADGTGYGSDGAVWGCELLIADLLGFERLAHLAYVPLPGGEQAVRQPWRMAAVYLERAYGKAFLDLDIPFVHALDRSKWHMLSQMAVRNINSPPTSSLGRLFDAVAALLGIHSQVQYEGQNAIEMEMLAQVECHPYPFTIQDGTPMELDVIPLIRAIVHDIQRGLPISSIAGRFHYSIASMLAQACCIAQTHSGVQTVALSGGVFQNRLLLECLMQHLKDQNFRVYINRRVPPNDGGISLGQLAIAAARLGCAKN